MRHWVMMATLASCAIELSAMTVERSGESGPEKRAVAELTNYIGLLAELEPDVTFRIGVGFLDLFPEDKAFLGTSDGYAVRKKDGAIYIVSPQPRGCLYGVYDFLERNSDIIWARPYEECGTMYTRRTAFEITEADFVEKPVFQTRGWWICGPQKHAPSEYWNARVRCNTECANARFPEAVARAVECGFSISGSNGHNLPRHMPDSVYETHPEYYALINGERRKDTTRVQFCFSNLDGAAVIGSNAVEQIAAKRAAGVPFSVWALKQADNQRTCECPNCQADILLPDGRVSTVRDVNFLSNRTYIYLNHAMEVIAKVYPDLRVQTYGYQFTAPPPDVKVHPNFDVVFCPFVKNDRFAVTNEVNRSWKDRTERWAKATKNIIWREYWGCAMGFPRQHSLVAVHDLRWINGTLGFTRVYSETQADAYRPARGSREGYDTRTLWDASAMEQWVLSRLMWNPYASAEGLRDYYVTRTYRKSAPPMREFWNLVAQGWFSDAAMSNYRDDPYANAARYMVRTKISKRLLELLDEAERLAADEIPATRNLIARQKAHFANLIANAGKLEEPIAIPCVTDRDWSKAQTIEGFQRVTANKKESRIAAIRRTRVSVMHDRKNFYVRFECDDPAPEKLEAPECSEARQEEFPGGDHVEFVLVTARGLNVHHFGVDANGNRGDIKNGDSKWNAKWKSVAKRTATGYVVGLSIDMESLGIELTQDNRFGACFARMAPHGGASGHREFSSWRGVHPQSVASFGEIFVNME